MSKSVAASESRSNLRIAYVAGNPKLCFSGLWKSLHEEYVSIAKIHDSTDRLSSVFSEFELRNLLEKEVWNLSGGESVRAAIGYLSLCQPSCWILDRAFEWLEPRHRKAMEGFFQREARAGKRVIFLNTRTPKQHQRSEDVGSYQNGWWTQGKSRISGNTVRIDQHTIVQARDVAVQYQDGTRIGPFDMDIFKGERLGMVGPNGAGKTSLAMAIAGLLEHTGSVEIGGVSMDGRKARTDLCLYSFQNPDDQIFRPSVRAEIFEIAKRLGVIDKDFCEEIIECLSLNEVLELDPIHLPLSVRRMVTLASVLVAQRAVVFLDEPTSFLAADQISMVGNAIKTASRKGSSLVAITHDRHFAETYLDRLIQI